MKTISYTVKDELGIHARPAGMGMGVKKNQTVTVKVEGDDEGAACDAIKAFFETNL